MTDPAVLDRPVEAPPPATVAPPSGPLAELILVRLLPAAKSVSVRDLRSALARFFRQPPSSETVNEVITALRHSGLLARGRGTRLSDEGRARAEKYLGLPAGSKASWATIQAKYLLPKALGLEPGSAEANSLSASSTLVPRLLKRTLGLPAGTRDTLSAVLEAYLCQQLGFPAESELAAVTGGIFARAIGSADRVTKKQAMKVIPNQLLGAKSNAADDVRAAVILRGLSGDAPTVLTPTSRSSATPVHQPEPQPDETFDLEDFANTVLSVARKSPTGRFGDNKVFISHVWRQLADEPRFARLGPDGFKAKLVEANRADLLTLTRADLVQVMDPAEVRESETAYLNATFHFIRIDKE